MLPLAALTFLGGYMTGRLHASSKASAAAARARATLGSLSSAGASSADPFVTAAAVSAASEAALRRPGLLTRLWRRLRGHEEVPVDVA